MIADKKESLEKLLADKNKRKRLFFYTDMKMWTSPNEKMINRLKAVLDYLEEQKDVYTLWNCFAGAGYDGSSDTYAIQNIIQGCKSYKNIICYLDQDKSSAYTKLADAYYGDYSKYVFDFLLQDKPLLICNWDVPEEIQSQALPTVRFECFAEQNDWIYFASSLTNGLFRGNLKTGQTDFLGCFPGEFLEICFLYTGCVRYENKIVFAPGMAENIAVYDTQNRTIEMIPLPDIEYKCRDRKKFSSVFVFEHFVFFIPNRIPVIIKMDMENYELKLLTEWYEHSLNVMLYPGDMLFTGDYSIADGKCYLPYCQRNLVLELDLCNDDTAFYRVGCEETYLSTIAYDGTFFWITGGMDCIISWDRETGETEEFPYPTGCNRGYNPFMYSEYQDGEIILLPETANMWVKIETQKKRVSELRIENLLHKAEGQRHGYCLRGDQNRHLLSCFCNGKVFQSGKDWSVEKEMNYAHPFASLDNFYGRSTYSREVCEKTGDFSQLQLLIETTKINRKKNIAEYKRRCNIGQEIHGLVKNMQIQESRLL